MASPMLGDVKERSAAQPRQDEPNKITSPPHAVTRPNKTNQSPQHFPAWGSEKQVCYLCLPAKAFLEESQQPPWPTGVVTQRRV